MRSQAFSVVEAFHIYHLAFTGQDLNRHIVITSVLEDYQPPMYTLQDQVQGQVAVSHRNDRIYGVRAPAADQVR